MKKNTLFLLLVIGIMFSSCSMNYPATVHGENYKSDKFERNGFSGYSFLYIENDMDQTMTITINRLDEITKDVISSTDYVIQSNQKVKIPLSYRIIDDQKVKIPYSERWVSIDDNIFDVVKFEVTPGMKKKIKLSGKPVVQLAESLDDWFVK